MHLRSIARALGLLILLMVVAMTFSLGWALFEYYQLPNDSTLVPLQAIGFAMIIGAVFGLILIGLGHRASNKIEIKEALLVVSLSWVFGGLVGALPMFLWAHLMPIEIRAQLEFSSYVNCFFEAVSGLTTTGASILSNIPIHPRPILLWRANIQWLGGLGIVVLFVAVLPWIASGNQRIYKAETTGITDAGTANIRVMARHLWGVYTLLTFAQVVVMKAVDPKLDWFTAITFGFSTAATAGFSVFNESAGTMTPLNQWVCIVFMLCGGVNYAMYLEMISRRWNRVVTDSEFRAYWAIVLVSIILITISISGTSYDDMKGHTHTPGIVDSIRNAAFQVASIQTTTGFSNANSDQWPTFAKIVLLCLMFIGGCGGSTGGGIKVIRVISTFKLMLLDIEKVYRPNIVRPLVVGRKILPPTARQGVLVYVLLVLMLTVAGTLIMAFLEAGTKADPLSLFSAVTACINSVGPGFGLVGVTQNYGSFTDGSKILLAAYMVIGRLEVFTVLAILLPRFWRKY